MVFHLGMSGRWRIDPDTPSPHDHLVLEADDHILALNDARRFGSVDLVDTDALDRWAPFAKLGPEPMADTLTAAHLAQVFAARKGPVKALLLDQSLIAGLGNIYVCEALFRAQLAPTRPGASLSGAALKRLTACIIDVIADAIAAGGSTIRDYAQPNGELGYFAARWQVYGREGLPCGGCGAPIARLVQGGRSTFWCPKCQK